MVIRPATEADIAEMAVAQFAAFWSNFNELVPGSHGYPGYRDKVVAFAEDSARQHWPDASVAIVDGELAGHCYIDLKTRILEGLWVKPEFQGQGIGGALIEDALARFGKSSLDAV